MQFTAALERHHDPIDVDKTIDLLALESPAPIAKDGSKWQLTAANLSESFWQRAERLTALRRDEQQQMQEYVGLPFSEHMGFLINALDGDASAVCPPGLPPLSAKVDPALSSSIFLTTVTDVAGFFFFLGLAALLIPLFGGI